MSPDPWYRPENLEKYEAAAHQGAGSGANEVFAAYRELAAGESRAHAAFHSVMDEAEAAAIAERLAEVLPERFRPSAVLDMGCGPGTITEALRRRFDARSVLGVDASRDAIGYAAKAYPACRFKSAVFTPETALGETFDLVYSREFYPFTRVCDPALQGPLLEGLARHILPGGVLAVVLLDWPDSLAPALPELEPRLKASGLTFLGSALEASPKLRRWPRLPAQLFTRAWNLLRRRSNRVCLLWRRAP